MTQKPFQFETCNSTLGTDTSYLTEDQKHFGVYTYIDWVDKYISILN